MSGDNLGSYRRGGGKTIEAAGATLLYLPRYSRDFNPIENAFSKLKALLRKTERTVDARIGALLDGVTPARMRKLFRCRRLMRIFSRYRDVCANRAIRIDAGGA